MISINKSFISTAKMTDLSVVSVCSLGFSGSELIATGLSGAFAVRPAGPAILPVRERNERPTKALEAGVAAAEAQAYAFAAASADAMKQTQHHTMWAFRGLEPWSDPA
ncbi:hypothetical protein [Streptomyces sp. AK02-01A]|uniref:hypothetical protein n=1 Tax=Streptomyces sp. AK02-01A TaxID=3028648 RepID=UPI0029B086F4|nr:hypothetical protein [Streptomyces sp. AK02-01A]MDX3852535.1 hypothetical protein [Streptomyces sp. AK02-01A]